MEMKIERNSQSLNADAIASDGTKLNRLFGECWLLYVFRIRVSSRQTFETLWMKILEARKTKYLLIDLSVFLQENENPISKNLCYMK